MSPPRPVPRKISQIKAEIEQTFGFFPPFYEPALVTPAVLENLWQQTLTAYIDNPLSALFKERLNARLSLFCSAPYCMIVHSAALRPLGMSASQVLALLDAPASEDQEIVPVLGLLSVTDDAAAPEPDSAIEKLLLYCSTSVFLERTDADQCQIELRRLLGLHLFSHLIAYLAYIKTCHIWIGSHPEIVYEADQRAIVNLGPLLAEEPVLADFFSTYSERVARMNIGRAGQAALAAERTRAAAAIRESEEKLRLLVDGAKDYAMILMDTQGCITNWNKGAMRILGWSEEEVLGQQVDFIFSDEDVTAGVLKREFKMAIAHGHAMDKRWQKKKDGSLFFADGIMEGLRDEDDAPCGFAKILRDATAQKLAEDERLELLELQLEAQRELSSAHKRTTDIVESITDGFCVIDRNWRFGYINPQAAQMLRRTKEELIGRSIWDEFPDAVGSPFCQAFRRAMDKEEFVLIEDYIAQLGYWIEFRVFPSTEGLSIFFQNVSERKAQEEERARLAERERNIATQLQSALQPELPSKVPGLAVTRYYEAALLDEASVGGDFFDVFLVENGSTALIVGDLSGKGLVAAAQVAMVRNMLRAFLYSKNTLAEAITDLNHVLAYNSLLAGFSTLFVGLYDDVTRTLKYANCGQEPALLRRAATGEIELLTPTGTILGVVDNSQFVEEIRDLDPGDALAIFSDGLTEVGASRKTMLGIEGVINLLSGTDKNEENLSAAELSEALALRIITGVDEASKDGVVRDDVCLLIAVVEA
jgi:PAS domain S-box-containing protein